MNASGRREPSLTGNLTRLYALNFLGGFQLLSAVLVPFFAMRELGLDDVYLLQGAFGLTVVLSEIPTGYLADRLGRRRAILVATVLAGIAYVVLLGARGFALFLVWEVLLGLSQSLWSGADVALLLKSVDPSADERAHRAVLSKRWKWAMVGQVVGALAGGALGSFDLLWVLYVSAGLAWLPVCFAWGLREPPGPWNREAVSWRALRRLGRSLLDPRTHAGRALVEVVLVGSAAWVVSWSLQALWTGHGLTGERHVFLGLFWASLGLVAAVAAHVIPRVADKVSAERIRRGVGWLPAAGASLLLVAVVIGEPTALVLALSLLAAWVFQVARVIIETVVRARLNLEVPEELRATANSATAVGARLSSACLGFGLGAGVVHAGFVWAYGGLLALYAMMGLGFSLRRKSDGEAG